MIALATAIAILIIGILFIKQSRKEKPKKIFRVYTQPGKWYCLKYYVFFALLTVRRLKYYVFGKSFLLKKEKLEKLQPLSNHDLAFDAVFFQAVTQDGIYFCTGIERRQKAKVVGLVYLVLPEYGVLESVHLPKTTLEAEPSSLLTMDKYAGGGISITPVEPMKKWKVSFTGKMRVQNNPDKLVDVDLNAEWHSNYEWMFFEIDTPSSVIARSIARETWTKEYFDNLKTAHQSHYEQMGYLSGTLTVDGRMRHLEDVDGFRDHSFGHKRDWSLMHRYIYHMFYLNNKVKISLGLVSQPSTSSHLEMGWVNHPNGRIDPVDNIDLMLYEHGENGVLPKELNFTFVAAGLSYEVKVQYVHEAMHFKGNDRDARLHERFTVCEVNGVKGRGISEWHYNNCKK